MKFIRVLLASIVLLVFLEFFMPLFSAKNVFLVGMVQSSCGAVPLFLDQVLTPTGETNPAYWAGFMKCSIGVLGLLLVPGTLTVLVKIYHFVRK